MPPDPDGRIPPPGGTQERMIKDAREAAVSLPRPDELTLPWPVRPMLAKPAPMPAEDDGWGFEFKWDGYRTLLFADRGRAVAQSRNLHDVTRQYPELQGIARALGPRRAILDGEVVVLDAQGRPSFERLQARAMADPAGFRLAPPDPVVLIAFDLLHLDDTSLMARPYAERRAALDGLGLEHEAYWAPAWHRDGLAVAHAAEEMGLEGVLAKRLDSPYEAGRRSGAWRKVKFIHTEEFVVGGWSPGEGARAGRVGALLVGQHVGGGLRFAGGVGTGFTEAALRDLEARLAPLRRAASPFDGPVPPGAVFVEPRLVCEVAFSAWTRDGHLRHPSFTRLREDKDPREVARQEDG